MSKNMHRNSRGFTLLEMLISMAIFLIISGAVLAGMSGLQANFRKTEIRTTMQQRMRGAMELMAQEIGQAGLQASTIEGDNVVTTAGSPYQITSAVTTTGLQTVTLNTLSGVYVGQWLQVDGGSNQDAIQITAKNTSNNQITAIFGTTHAVNTPAYPMGVFPHGVVIEQTNSSKLSIFGDINGSGNGLYAVEYLCPTSFPGSLTRIEWNLLSTPLTATAYPLIDNVTACSFIWNTSPDTVTLPNGAGANVTYSMITQVGFTITVTENPTVSGSNQTISITKSYSNIQPRNIIAADNIYQAACATALVKDGSNATYANYLHGELQPDPTELASVPWQ
jgi:prepilin-type N-terminal cleavage/methylation domain-containing protein